MAIRVGTELLREVVQRGLDAPDHALQVLGVPRVMEDLDGDIFPVSFTHRVIRREQRVLIPDGAICDVVVIAAPGLCPCPLQLPRRNGDLILVRAHGRVEGDPLAGPGQAGVQIATRMLVVEQWNLGTRGEAMRPTVPRIPELARGCRCRSRAALIADGGQPLLIREMGAVRNDRDVHSVLTEATGVEMHLEVEP